MLDKFHNHEFEIFEYPDDNYPMHKYYYYRIYIGNKDYIESEGNMFDGIQEAKFAAVGHILKIIEQEFKS